MIKPSLADEADLCKFHFQDYISFLKNVVPDEEVSLSI